MRILVVFFSRSGVTERAAAALRDVLEASDGVQVRVEPLRETTSRKGVLGWLRSGRDAMLKRTSDAGPVECAMSDFDLLVVGTPVWAWDASPAVRTFLEQSPTELPRHVAFFCTMGGTGATRTFRTLGQLAGREPIATLSLVDRHVKRDDAARFREPVKAFAERLLAVQSR